MSSRKNVFISLVRLGYADSNAAVVRTMLLQMGAWLYLGAFREEARLLTAVS